MLKNAFDKIVKFIRNSNVDDEYVILYFNFLFGMLFY